MKFCDKLAKLRKSNNLSQEQLADIMGVSRQSISKWESGSTYPDMEKIIQLCKVLNCNLEDIMDDGVIGESSTPIKNKKENIFTKILNTITKTYDMLKSMTLKGKFKCIFELCIITLVVFILLNIINLVTDSLIYRILTTFSYTYGYFFYKVLSSSISFALFIFGIIVVFHLFKERYLNYFTFDEKKKIDELVKVSNKDVSGEYSEKIVIRDPNHSSLKLANTLKNVAKIILKIFFALILFPILFSFLISIFLSVLSIYHIDKSILFLLIAIFILSITLLIYIIIEYILKFLFDIHQSLKRLFIMFIIGLVSLGISSGLIFLSVLDFKYVDTSAYESFDHHIVTHYIDMKENQLINMHYYDTNYIIDNSINNIKVDIDYISDFDFVLYNSSTYEENYNVISFYFTRQDFPYNQIYHAFIEDIKNKTIRNYNTSSLVKITITLNEENYNTLMLNKEKYEY